MRFVMSAAGEEKNTQCQDHPARRDQAVVVRIEADSMGQRPLFWGSKTPLRGKSIQVFGPFGWSNRSASSCSLLAMVRMAEMDSLRTCGITAAFT